MRARQRRGNDRPPRKPTDPTAIRALNYLDVAMTACERFGRTAYAAAYGVTPDAVPEICYAHWLATQTDLYGDVLGIGVSLLAVRAGMSAAEV